MVSSDLSSDKGLRVGLEVQRHRVSMHPVEPGSRELPRGHIGLYGVKESALAQSKPLDVVLGLSTTMIPPLFDPHTERTLGPIEEHTPAE